MAADESRPGDGGVYADVALWKRTFAALPAALVAVACLSTWSVYRIADGVRVAYDGYLADGQLASAILTASVRVLVHLVFVAVPVAVAVVIIRPRRVLTRQLWSTRAILLSIALVIWVPVAGLGTFVLG